MFRLRVRFSCLAFRVSRLRFRVVSLGFRGSCLRCRGVRIGVTVSLFFWLRDSDCMGRTDWFTCLMV